MDLFIPDHAKTTSRRLGCENVARALRGDLFLQQGIREADTRGYSGTNSVWVYGAASGSGRLISVDWVMADVV